MAAKDEMRRKIQKNQSNLRKKKEEERKKKEALKVETRKNTRKNPFHRKHGDDAEKKRIDSMAHLSNREKRVKKRNIDAGTPGKSTTTSKKTTRVKGRKLSPYEMKKEARLQAMRDRARAKHKAWKESRKKK